MKKSFFENINYSFNKNTNFILLQFLYFAFIVVYHTVRCLLFKTWKQSRMAEVNSVVLVLPPKSAVLN